MLLYRGYGLKTYMSHVNTPRPGETICRSYNYLYSAGIEFCDSFLSEIYPTAGQRASQVLPYVCFQSSTHHLFLGRLRRRSHRSSSGAHCTLILPTQHGIRDMANNFIRVNPTMNRLKTILNFDRNLLLYETT